MSKLAEAVASVSGIVPKPEPVTAPASNLAPSRRGKKGIIVYVDPTVAKRLRQLALDNNSSVQKLGEEALNMLLERYGQQGIA